MSSMSTTINVENVEDSYEILTSLGLLSLHSKENKDEWQHDGRFFLKKVADEKRTLLGLCEIAAKELDSNEQISEAFRGQLRVAQGKAMLLINKKFPQFEGLCEKSLQPSSDGQKVLPGDLAGLWEVVQMEISSVKKEFSSTGKEPEDTTKKVTSLTTTLNIDGGPNDTRKRNFRGEKKVTFESFPKKNESDGPKLEKLKKARRDVIAELRKSNKRKSVDIDVEFHLPKNTKLN